MGLSKKVNFETVLFLSCISILHYIVNYYLIQNKYKISILFSIYSFELIYYFQRPFWTAPKSTKAREKFLAGKKNIKIKNIDRDGMRGERRVKKNGEMGEEKEARVFLEKIKEKN